MSREYQIELEDEAHRLRAELANARQENEEFRSEYGELEVKLENCEAELAEARRALLAGNDTVLANKKLQERVAELDGQNQGMFTAICNLKNALQAAEARIAELEIMNTFTISLNKQLQDAQQKSDARAERAEAQLAEAKAEREQIELANKEFGDQLAHAHVQLAEAKARLTEANDHLHGLVAEKYARAEWAEAELDIADGIITSERARAERAEAERDALHLFSGAQAAVIKEMREALEFYASRDKYKMLSSVGIQVLMDGGTKARAALAPSPAGEKI